MALQILQQQQGSVRILALNGRLDTETAADLELTIQDLIGAGERHFVIDLDAISYVSSAGLRVLLMLAKELDAGRGSLRLAGLSSAVAQVFDVAGFTAMFAIFLDRATALYDHPQATADPELAVAAAKLLRAQSRSTSDETAQAAQELAQRAARLLGVEPPKSVPPSKSRKAPPAKPQPFKTTNPPATRTQAPATSGLIGKLRHLFGGKR